ncbi:MAG: hypothetical protein COT91_02520 [Candidatus Doudnabacteria bacterium CG10_big_fil_rev_8_21_14_0_10_41_10]|uniref:DUF8173 domain-containing protein n=1 Tax=Candidatus Doudnabacteria bacterium CG10_big_fil_rev_8_21_14_0_10_41_10 TaxID=1974551 RepID=A0A2H0VDM3_9BACT|nr:MAG: hypothetical protein COT91_02520 [Candidatus Doudnabacteria bacterium CG10_big_fil_rev_8_21_14_0_10_41_10]
MKKTKLVLVAVVLLLIPAVALGGLNKGEKEVVISKTTVHSGDFVNGAATVDVSGTVEGDVMTAGAQVDISGTVEGDILSAGGQVDISGDAGQDVRLVGGNVFYSGTTKQNFSAFGGNVRLSTDSMISGNAYIGGGNVELKGVIIGNVKAGSGKLVVAGEIGGDLVVYADEISVRDGAIIKGNFTYYSKIEANISEGATIGGAIEKKNAKPTGSSSNFDKGKGFLFGFFIWRLLAALIVALVFWQIFRDKIKKALDDGNNSCWKKIGTGLVLMIVTPIAAIIAMVTILGLPIGLIGMGLYLIGTYLGMILGVVLFGNWIVKLIKLPEKGDGFPWMSYFVGMIVLSVISVVPLIGAVASFLILSWGVGSLYPLLKR